MKIMTNEEMKQFEHKVKQYDLSIEWAELHIKILVTDLNKEKRKVAKARAELKELKNKRSTYIFNKKYNLTDGEGD